MRSGKINFKEIRSEGAPPPVGPYSQAVESGGFVFVSGQIPLDTGGTEVSGSDIKTQTARVMDNVSNILKAAGCGLENVVSVSIFLKNMEDFSALNEEYAGYFPGEIKPARCVIQAAGLPKGVLVEVSCIAKKT